MKPAFQRPAATHHPPIPTSSFQIRKHPAVPQFDFGGALIQPNRSVRRPRRTFEPRRGPSRPVKGPVGPSGPSLPSQFINIRTRLWERQEGRGPATRIVRCSPWKLRPRRAPSRPVKGPVSFRRISALHFRVIGVHSRAKNSGCSIADLP